MARLAGAGQEWKNEENSSIAGTECEPATGPAQRRGGWGHCTFMGVDNF